MKTLFESTEHGLYKSKLIDDFIQMLTETAPQILGPTFPSLSKISE